MSQPKLCEIYTDLLNYEKLGSQPKKEDFDDEQHYYDTLKSWLARRDSNETKRMFYNAIRYLLYRYEHVPITKSHRPPADDKPVKDLLDELSDEQRVRFLAISGMLLADGYRDPLTGKRKQDLSAAAGDVVDLIKADSPDSEVFMAASFVDQSVRARSEYARHADMFGRVYVYLREQSKSSDGKESTFSSRQMVEVTRQVVDEGVEPDDPQIALRIQRALARTLSGAKEGPPSSIDIDIPDLEEGTVADIHAPNVEPLAGVYLAAHLEELKYFAVMDRVVEQFMSGALPVSRGPAGDELYQYFRTAPMRMNELERRGLYARSFGLAQGSVDEPLPNREFNDLWIRFLAAVSYNSRESGSLEPRQTSREQVFKSARDLAVNMSLHGYGLVHFAAVELLELIRHVKKVLSYPELLQAYGVRDVWQLVERVSGMYLGGDVNSVRQRTMGQSGAKIIQWLAAQAPNLAGANRYVHLDPGIISHVERWLAVTGTPGSAVVQYAEPVAIKNQRTLPSSFVSTPQLPDSLRNALTNVGLPEIPQA